MFVGRARELAALERALAEARAGRGSTVLVAGEAGIGKTRLVCELTARADGCDALTGRCLDLVGTELPYQPFAEALGGLPQDGASSQLHVFEAILARVRERAPAVLVLEDLHWADASTLDVVVFLAHNLRDLAVLQLATYRPDEPASAERMRRLAEGVRRSGAAAAIELGPLEPDELAAVLAERSGESALTDAIIARAEGNPFFAEELLAAGERDGALPPGLRELLLQRVAWLGPRTQVLLRVVAAAGRDVSYPLLRDAAGLPEDAVRESLRTAVDHGVLVADQHAGSFRFRHALLAEAVYATILPGEREALHARLAEQLADASPAELAPHWTAAGRAAEAVAASAAAARDAAAVFGLAEALGHLERALALWGEVPDAEARAGLDLATACSWAAELAGHVGHAPRAVELAERALRLVDDPHRASRLQVDLGEYLYATGSDGAGLAALERAVELVPAEPPSPARAFALGSLAGGLMLAERREESLALARQALQLARQVGAGAAEVRALTVIGGDLAYLRRADEGLAYFRDAVRLAQEIGDHLGLARAYTNLTDALTMLGRYRESARVAQTGLEAMSRLGIAGALLAANGVEALLAIGEWDEAERLSAGALRRITSSFPYWLLVIRAEVETGRGRLDAARAHLEAARATLPEDHVFGLYDGSVAELALWEHRWTDADAAVHDGLAHAQRSGATAAIQLQLCAKGLRAQAELAALARARRDAGGLRRRLDRARKLRALARRAAGDGSGVTPTAAAWHAVCEAEYSRTGGAVRPDLWAASAQDWDRLDRAPLAAYCRWRQAEALATAGAPRAQAAEPLRAAHAVATRLGARPLLRELELLAQRARLDPAPLPAGPPRDGLAEQLGLTPRESEVLALVARGLTNREIADALVISAKTASVHVSHILQKLDAPNRREAAAIAQRMAPPSATGAGAAVPPGS